ncbi:adenylate cyclase [Streptomyces sulfonofaciens]|uniref:Adenylate cyclase n=1 Tax=Streptomyces sulfonofaciens TaxID=68272 RepID=A0A919GN66_9ACTN|nr:CYTH domain-containing protein [Streptomyces sulfonofaciens]GHH87692.1 adenylate cyclase [Streptomyces sulfonofaciens]
MSNEIERKFLAPVTGPFSEIPATPVQQGYLARGENEEARVRRQGDEYTLAVKKGRGIKRQEFEIAIGAQEFAVLWPATEGARVSKSRRALPLHDGAIAYVDVFEGHLAPLATVEVEFGSEEEAWAFEPPEWFGPEVTGDDRYANANLSSSGAPPAPSPTGQR